MSKLLNKYNNIMQKYRRGEFGNEQLTLYDIMAKAGEPDILDKMNLSEIHALTVNSSGLLRQLFSVVECNKKGVSDNMKDLEH